MNVARRRVRAGKGRWLMCTGAPTLTLGRGPKPPPVFEAVSPPAARMMETVRPRAYVPARRQMSASRNAVVSVSARMSPPRASCGGGPRTRPLAT